MATTTTTPDPDQAPPGPRAGRAPELGRALWSSSEPAWRSRDAFARGVVRAGVLALEVLAAAFVVAGLVGVAQQVPSAGSVGAFWLPALAIAVFAGLAALMCLALASALLLQVRMSRDLDELYHLTHEARSPRVPEGHEVQAEDDRRSAA